MAFRRDSPGHRRGRLRLSRQRDQLRDRRREGQRDRNLRRARPFRRRSGCLKWKKKKKKKKPGEEGRVCELMRRRGKSKGNTKTLTFIVVRVISGVAVQAVNIAHLVYPSKAGIESEWKSVSCRRLGEG